MIKLITVVFTALLALGSTAPPPPMEIQSGFEFLAAIEGKVFVRPIENERMTYQAAIERCAAAGYRIATIESEAQNVAVGNYTCGPEYRWVWIDGIDIVTPDVYFSVNTGKNLTYFSWTKWGRRPIIGKDDYNCIRLSCNAGDPASMWDVECDDKYSVFCEV